MAFTFDPEKSARNLALRGLAFDRVAELEWASAVIRQDTRKDYGEVRLRVFARLDGVLHAAVVTPRDGDLRVISFRIANRKERILYG
jgi:uncharacterized DUF497 family protein